MSKYAAKFNRRQFIKWTGVGVGATFAASYAGLVKAAPPYRVIVIGGGFAGATAAKYLKLWGGSSVDVTLIEPKASYYTPILSNLVLNGNLQLSQLEIRYTTLTSRYGVTHRQDTVTAIDGANRTVTLSDGTELSYDRLIVAPGMSFKPLPGVNGSTIDPNDPASGILHAWKGGQQVQDLRNALVNMPSGGTFVMTIPPSPFRCPPGPYERACVVADWLRRNRPGSKVVVLDANADIVVEKESFGARFAQYGVDYRSNVQIQSVAPSGLGSGSVTVSVNGGAAQTFTADVLNVIPSQRAGAYSLMSQASLLNGDWAPVNARTFESLQVAGIHVIGDSQGTGVPKAGHIANSEAKVCAEAVLNLLHGQPVYSAPKINSACYSPVSANEATWLTGGFAYDATKNNWVLISASFASGPPTTRHYSEMFGWAKNLFSDTFM